MLVVNFMKNFENCNFPLSSAKALVRTIHDSIQDSQPLSMIRLGDGEGLMLARPSPDDVALWERVVFHFGPTMGHHIDALAKMLISAIGSADIVGVRDDIVGVNFPPEQMKLNQELFLYHFRKEFKLREIDQRLPYEHAFRLALLHHHLCTQTFKESTAFVSAWSHFDLSSSGELIKLIIDQESIGLISSKTTLATDLKSLLDINVNFYQVPDIYWISQQAHFPDVFNSVMDDLKVEFPGQLFLVGAGICGKLYCQRIRELGGVALDIGSVCDAWVNVPSRVAVYKDKYDYHGDAVPQALTLRHQVDNL